MSRFLKKKKKKSQNCLFSKPFKEINWCISNNKDYLLFLKESQMKKKNKRLSFRNTILNLIL